MSTALNSGVPLALTNHSEIAAQFGSFTRQLLGMQDDAEGGAGAHARRSWDFCNRGSMP